MKYAKIFKKGRETWEKFSILHNIWRCWSFNNSPGILSFPIRLWIHFHLLSCYTCDTLIAEPILRCPAHELFFVYFGRQEVTPDQNLSLKQIHHLFQLWTDLRTTNKWNYYLWDLFFTTKSFKISILLALLSGNKFTIQTFHRFAFLAGKVSAAFLREAFQSKKQRNLGISPNSSVGNSSTLGGGGPSEIKKVPSSRGYQRLKNNDSFSSYEEPKTLDFINYCTKHGQIYHYITHIDWFCTNIFHIQLVLKNF